MRARLALILLTALAACSSQTDKQLQAVKSARSVLSEWALVEEQAARGRAPSTYVEVMRKQARDQLRSASRQLSQQPAAVRLLQGFQQGSPDAAELKQAGSTLEPLEKRLEAS
jgi:hypothetical protein